MGFFYLDERWTRLLDTEALPENMPVPQLKGPDVRIHGFHSRKEYVEPWRFIAMKPGVQALVKEYYEDYRVLRNVIGRKTLEVDSLEENAVNEMFNAMSFVKSKVDAATTLQELRDARASFLTTKGCMNEAMAEDVLLRYQQWFDEQARKDALAKSANTIVGYRLTAHTEVRKVAVSTSFAYNVQGDLICHMVSVVIDLDSGQWAAGRAGHGMGKAQLTPVLGFELPDYAASAFSTQNAYNCAELQALFKLKQKVPALNLKKAYFAAMMPGGSPIIPPCANCRRWIKAQGAAAAKME